MEIKEKKWTDEEILQEMQAHQEAAECYGFVQVIGKQMNRWLDLIHRLQGENERLTREVDKQKNFVTAWEESWKIAYEQNTKIRVKLKKENAELQKQVDELTASREIAINELHEQHAIVAEEIRRQMAKEIFETIFNDCWAVKDENGQRVFVESIIRHIAKKRYGVEVE